MTLGIIKQFYIRVTTFLSYVFDQKWILIYISYLLTIYLWTIFRTIHQITPDYYLSLNIKHRQVNVSIKSDFQEENQNSKR